MSEFNNITLIGDTHGNPSTAKNYCHRFPDHELIGIGDVGIGFPGKQPTYPANFRFFRGNHDNPPVCKAHPQYIHDYGLYKGVFIVAGAASIDKEYRTVGVDWWEDEELSSDEQGKCLDAYCEAKPSVLVSHEAPNFLHKFLVAAASLNNPFVGEYGEPKGTRTGYLLERMIKAHEPKVCIFGHWHVSCRIKFDDCQYICLDIDERLRLLDIEKYL